MRKLKILHVIPHLGIGGINKFVLDLVYYQRTNNNIEVGIYVVSNRNVQWKDSFKDLNVNIYFGNFSQKDFDIFHYRSFNLVKAQYDVIHWHVFFPLLSYTSFFDRKVHIFTHHSVLGKGRISKITDNLKWKMFKFWVNNRLNCEVYNSNFTKNFWQQYGLCAKKNCLIYNGINFNLFGKDVFQHVEMSHLNKNSFVIGTSSNFIGCKRINILISIFSKWAVDKEDVVLLLVGDGNEYKYLKEVAASLGQKDKIFFAGHQQNVTPYQQKMDICVFPSITETFGLAALECLYLKKPTLCMNDGGGICEVIGDSQNIIKSEDHMLQMFNYYYELKNKKGTCENSLYRQRALLFDMKNKAQEYVELYQSLSQC